MKRIAILGGTFDPVTNAHIEIANKVSEQYNCKVLFLIAKNTRWKDEISDFKLRYDMLSIALKNEKNLEICTLEIDKEGFKKNHTIDSVIELMDIYKNHEIYYIIGTDQLERLDEWIEIEALSKLVTFVVIHRSGYPLDQEKLELYLLKALNL